MKDKHIHTIRRQLGVSLATLCAYNREHKEEIKHIRDIFYLDGENKKKVLALFYIFSSGEEDDVIKKYREQLGLNSADHDPAILIEQYKVLLLTALIFNRDFYTMGVNSRGFISAGLAIGEIKRDSFVTPIRSGGIVQQEGQSKQGNIISFPKSNHGIADKLAASAKDIDSSLE